ncbi:lipopolysaccharide biosynthesis protein [Botrimarina sp.]|uniref:lipopolysaccharide biosynthesis protein n=1 Tax=Botrimarina sp. TaxID=2795802 RepID=UPI0032ECAA09
MAQDYFRDAAASGDLRRQTVRGGVATVIAQAITTLTTLAAIPVLARLLDPEDFGLIAMVTVFTNFAAMFVDAGLSLPTIQRPRITAAQVSNLFWISVLIALTVACVVASASPLIAWVFDEPRLVGITLAIVTSFVFAGLSVQHTALLRRQLMFASLSAVQVVSVASGQACAVGWAFAYRDTEFDYWALVIGPIASSAITAAMAWVFCSWRPSAPKPRTGTRELASFGAQITGFSILNYLSRNADSFLIGWKWGDVALGYYDRAYRVFLAPIVRITVPFATVTVPALSRLSHDAPRFERAYLRLLRPALSLPCPLAMLMLLNAELVIDTMLGPRFEQSIPIFRCLALVGLVQPFCHSLTWILTALGRGKAVLTIGVLSAVVKCTAFACGLPWGPVGVAAAYAIASLFVYTPIAVAYVHSQSPFSIVGPLKEFAMAQALGLVVGVASVASMAVFSGDNPWVRLLIVGLVGAATWGLVVAGTGYGRALIADFRGIRGGAVGGAPSAPSAQ